MTIVQERLDALATLTLKNGSHPDPELAAQERGVMAWLAVAVFADAFGLITGWLLDRHTDRRGARR